MLIVSNDVPRGTAAQALFLECTKLLLQHRRVGAEQLAGLACSYLCVYASRTEPTAAAVHSDDAKRRYLHRHHSGARISPQQDCSSCAVRAFQTRLRLQKVRAAGQSNPMQHSTHMTKRQSFVAPTCRDNATNRSVCTTCNWTSSSRAREVRAASITSSANVRRRATVLIALQRRKVMQEYADDQHWSAFHRPCPGPGSTRLCTRTSVAK